MMASGIFYRDSNSILLQRHSNLMRHTPVTPNKFTSLSSSSLAKKKKKRTHVEVNLEEP